MIICPIPAYIYAISNILSFKKQKSAYDKWMKELKKTAFIEISLFDEPEKNISSGMNGSKKNKKIGGINSRRKKVIQNNIDNLRKQTIKQQMEEKWVEMYKSVEKTKHRTTGKSISSFQTLKEKI